MPASKMFNHQSSIFPSPASRPAASSWRRRRFPTCRAIWSAVARKAKEEAEGDGGSIPAPAGTLPARGPTSHGTPPDPSASSDAPSMQRSCRPVYPPRHLASTRKCSYEHITFPAPSRQRRRGGTAGGGGIPRRDLRHPAARRILGGLSPVYQPAQPTRKRDIPTRLIYPPATLIFLVRSRDSGHHDSGKGSVISLPLPIRIKTVLHKMITRDEALALAAKYWNETVERDGDEFHESSVELTSERDYWIIQGNTKAGLVGGDERRILIGISCFIIDSDSGTLEIVGSAQKTCDILQDCRDNKLAAGKHYVLSGGTGNGSLEEVSALRKIFPIGVSRARQFLLPPKRHWFTGKRRFLLEYKRELSHLGMPSEILLLDHAPQAIEVDWQSGFSFDLDRLAEITKEAEQAAT